MGFFAFDGNNIIYSDMLSKLPDGKVYFKDKNVIPIMDEVVYVELFNDYPIATPINVYINDKLSFQTNTLPDRSIYVKMAPPYGKFIVRTEVQGNDYRQEIYYAINLLSFCVIVAKTYEYDYVQILEMFGNLYAPTSQDDQIEKKYGFIFDFARNGISWPKYRQDVVGDLTTYTGAYRAFMREALLQSLSDLINSFTGSPPVIENYKEFVGYLLELKGYPYWNIRFPHYWLVNHYKLLGTVNLTSLDVSGQIFEIIVNGYQHQIVFPIGTVGIAAIFDQVKAVWKGFVSLNGPYLQIEALQIQIVNGASLGFTIGVYTNNIVENWGNRHVILMSDRFKRNTIRLNAINNFESDYEKATLLRLINLIVPANLKVEVNFKNSVWQPLLI